MTTNNSEDVRFSWEVKFVALDKKQGFDQALPDWLSELREMRGRVCYEEGHRPFFRLSDGKFCDPDLADLSAYHIITRLEGRAVGCARILPLTNGQPSTLLSTIGKDRFEEILSRIGTTRTRSCEASRWLVVPECRKGLGPKIVAASWAIAQWLSVQAAFVLAGTRQKQDCALIRMGARTIPDLPLFPSQTFDDDLRVLYFDVSHPSERMAKQIAQMTGMLKLRELSTQSESGFEVE